MRFCRGFFFFVGFPFWVEMGVWRAGFGTGSCVHISTGRAYDHHWMREIEKEPGVEIC